jgi:NADH-quinone oxidoreductase subunit L
VGICSYLLIGFYYERTSASNAANKAFITNRVGDAGFIIGLLILWTYVGTLNFEEIFAHVRAPVVDSHNKPMALAGHIIRVNEIDQTPDGKKVLIQPEDGSQVLLFPRAGHLHAENLAPTSKAPLEDVQGLPGEDAFGSMPYWLLVVAGLGIFLGCVGKSAQFPLHVWLPDAMEGPTPVSALIHAATMVAAGVYLVGRCFPLFTPESRLVIAYTGGITLFVAATIALVMTDIKKVLAYSTVSQLGYMMLALGVGGWAAGLFHLITHAFFKALLFLGSGSVIYGCHHEQDMLKMGGLYPKMKVTALTMLVGVLAIMGMPLFSGWYSKDAILGHAAGFAWMHPQHALLFLLPLFTAGITTFYMFRMWFLTFTGQPRDHHVHEHAHESPQLMTVPLVILAFFSIVVAWGWPLWDAHASALEHQIHHAQHHSVTADFGVVPLVDESGVEVLSGTGELREHYYAHVLSHLVGFIALGIVLVGFTMAALMYYRGVLDPEEAREQFPAVHRFLSHKWYFDEVYSAVLVRPALVVAHWCRNFDGRAIDGFVNSLGRFTVRFSDWQGLFDARIIDGIVNVIGNAVYGVGDRLRGVQTGYLRSYVLFLVLSIIGIYVVFSYFVSLASAG